MKIAQVVCTFPPYKGGMGNVAFHYSLELAKLGHEVTVFTPRYHERVEKMHNFIIKSQAPWASYGLAALLPTIFWPLRKYDVIHLHYPFYGGAWPIYCLKKCRPKKTKLVITYHMDTVGVGWKGRVFRFHAKYFLPLIVGAADKVIVSSLDYARTSYVANLLKKYPEKFVEIPFGANLKIFNPQEKDQALMKKYQIEPEQKTILFVAALDQAHYFKGLDDLLQALALLPVNTRLLVVGRGELRPYYEAKAKELGVLERVCFVGYVSDFDLARHYNLCDVFALASVDRSEAFGLVFVEAMACGKPVVASNLAGVRTVVDDGISGFLVEPHQVEQLAERLNRILSDDQLAKKMGQAGLARVRRENYWPLVAERVNKIYSELV